VRGIDEILDGLTVIVAVTDSIGFHSDSEGGRSIRMALEAGQSKLVFEAE
jgi:hypothetical protein